MDSNSSMEQLMETPLWKAVISVFQCLFSQKA